MNAQRPQLTKAAINLMGRALGTALTKGTLQMYGGRWGGESILLAEFPFPQSFTFDDQTGIIRFGKFDAINAKGTGDATWYRAKVNDPNAPLIEGSIGTEKANMIVEKTKIYAGMELTLEGFEYALTMRLGG